jgi:hypothetical protein
LQPHPQIVYIPILAGLPTSDFSSNNVLLRFITPSGAPLYHYGTDIDDLVVPCSTAHLPIFAQHESRVNATGHWLLLYMTPTGFQPAHPVLVFVDNNVADVLAVTSTVVAGWLAAQLNNSLAIPGQPPAPRIWSVPDAFNITVWWGRDRLDRRVFQLRPLLVVTTVLRIGTRTSEGGATRGMRLTSGAMMRSGVAGE